MRSATVFNLRLLILAMVCLGALAGPARAQWSQQQRSEFMGDCEPGCRNNPKVSAPYKDRCPRYCACVVEEGEKIFTTSDYSDLDRDSRAGRDTPQLKRFSSLFPICNARVFGN